jgi:hypothetical protein
MLYFFFSATRMPGKVRYSEFKILFYILIKNMLDIFQVLMDASPLNLLNVLLQAQNP